MDFIQRCHAEVSRDNEYSRHFSQFVLKELYTQQKKQRNDWLFSCSSGRRYIVSERGAYQGIRYCDYTILKPLLCKQQTNNCLNCVSYGFPCVNCNEYENDVNNLQNIQTGLMCINSE